MTSVKALRTARQSYSVALRDYLNCKGKSRYLHIFLENQADPSYYLHHLRTFFRSDREIIVYRCMNKANVEKAASALRDGISIHRNVFLFADSDYDVFIQHDQDEDVYYTDYYSIESEVVNEEVLKRIWLTMFHNLPKKEKMASFINKWNSLLRKFIDRLAINLFSIIIEYRKYNIKGNLGNLSIKDGILYGSGGRMSVKRYKAVEISREAIPNFIQNNRHLTKNVMTTREGLKSMEPLLYIRGKQAYELLMLFLKNERLRLEALYKASPKFKTDVFFEISTPFSILAPLTTTPATLIKYFQSKMI